MPRTLTPSSRSRPSKRKREVDAPGTLPVVVDLEELSCPICTHISRRLRACTEQGHQICYNCWKILPVKVCPSCRCDMAVCPPPVRFANSVVSTNFTEPCEQPSCKQLRWRDGVEGHPEESHQCLVACPVDGCGLKIVDASFTDHLIWAHAAAKLSAARWTKVPKCHVVLIADVTFSESVDDAPPPVCFAVRASAASRYFALWTTASAPLAASAKLLSFPRFQEHRGSRPRERYAAKVHFMPVSTESRMGALLSTVCLGTHVADARSRHLRVSSTL